MKSLFPNPVPRQRERVALGKGTWQGVLESPHEDFEVDLNGGPEMCQAWCLVCPTGNLIVSGWPKVTGSFWSHDRHMMHVSGC